MATSALAYGLMGAAKGLMGGIYDQWQQGQEDIRTQKLLDAKMAEERSLAALKAQYDSAANYEKTMLEFQTKLKLQDADATNKAALQASKDQADAEQKALDRASEEKRASMSAGATLGAAKIRATADATPGARGEQIWQLPDGTNRLVKPDEAPPEKGQLIWTNGGSVGARQRGGTPGPVSMLGGMPASAPADDDGAPAAPPAFSTPPTPPAISGRPGSSQNNPVAATAFSAPPPPGTWVRLPSGRVTQVPGA